MMTREAFVNAASRKGYVFWTCSGKIERLRLHNNTTVIVDPEGRDRHVVSPKAQYDCVEVTWTALCTATAYYTQRDREVREERMSDPVKPAVKLRFPDAHDRSVNKPWILVPAEMVLELYNQDNQRSEHVTPSVQRWLVDQAREKDWKDVRWFKDESTMCDLGCVMSILPFAFGE